MQFLVFNNYLKHPEPYKHFISILPSAPHARFQVKSIPPPLKLALERDSFFAAVHP